MSSANNVIEAKFNAKERKSVIGPLWQYDYGQILRITGIELPEIYEVHFSNAPRGIAKVISGNPDGVSIPDEYLTTGSNVFAWLFLHTGADDGGTEYQIEIQVRRKARPVNIAPTPIEQNIITNLIADIGNVVQTVNELKEETEKRADEVESEYDSIVESAKLSKSYSEGGTGVREDEDVSNSKYWYEQSKKVFSDGFTDIQDREEEVLLAISDEGQKQIEDVKAIAQKVSEDAMNLAQQACDNAERYASNADSSAQNAAESAKEVEEKANIVDSAISDHNIDVTSHNDLRNTLKSVVERVDDINRFVSPGAEMAGMLLYIGPDGNASYLKFGDGLKIEDGTLMVVLAEPICGKALCGEIKCGG